MSEPKTFLMEIEELLNKILGVPSGTLALKGLLDRYGGMEVYLPTSTDIYIAWRNDQIRLNFTGDNYAALASEWGLDERQIRRIINEE